jgi:two-component system nitrogen regulation response regulator NtrX
MSRKKILVVDDEQSIRHSLEGILSDEGYEVVTAPDGMSAIRYLQVSQESFPDAVLLDIWMPHFDGIETLKQIKAEFSDLIVVMMM